MIGLSVPLFNEEALVDSVVEDIVEVLSREGIPYRIALVDNGSLDTTGARIEGLLDRHPGLLAVRLSPNQGYGGGILSGVERLLQEPAVEVLGWIWGDGQVSPEVLPALYADCQAGSPMAKARRTDRQTPLVRRLVSAGFEAFTSALGVRSADINGCPKLFRREALVALGPRCRGWSLDAEVMIGAEARGWRVAERPVRLRERAAGESKVRVSTAVEIARHVVGWKLRG